MSTGLSYPSQLRFTEKCFNVSTNTAVKTCMVMGRQCFGPLIGEKRYPGTIANSMPVSARQE